MRWLATFADKNTENIPISVTGKIQYQIVHTLFRTLDVLIHSIAYIWSLEINKIYSDTNFLLVQNSFGNRKLKNFKRLKISI